MKKYFIFGKFGYEDQFVETFEDSREGKNKLERWLIKNADASEPAGIEAIVYGEEVKIEIVKRATSVKWG